MCFRYIDNPYLINGKKFDIRLFTLVTSFDPLRLYVFEDGLVRFATEDYSTDPALFRNRFVHLTNFAINKKSKKFVPNVDADDDGVGSKW